ncbi:MAG: 4Fe-4S dicluster domain-containing protein [Euryarchaeota archaeon]|nr:4Fe-4S dicluster domain-containing protein [Euryarchaeota archaeon]
MPSTDSVQTTQKKQAFASYRCIRIPVRMPIVCKQCKEPACRDSCPTGAITVDDGVVAIDEEKCVSCQSCAISCPDGAIFVHSDIDTPFKCDLCGGDPTCARVCPKKTILFVPEHTLGQVHRMASAPWVRTSAGSRVLGAWY